MRAPRPRSVLAVHLRPTHSCAARPPLTAARACMALLLSCVPAPVTAAPCTSHRPVSHTDGLSHSTSPHPFFLVTTHASHTSRPSALNSEPTNTTATHQHSHKKTNQALLFLSQITMTSTPSSYNSVEKNEPILADVGESNLVRDAVAVSPTCNTRAAKNLRKYRGLRITLSVLSGVIGLLALASCAVDILICAKASKYSGYDRLMAENEANGGDESLEGESITLFLFQLAYAVCVFFAVYCLVVMLVCFILTFTSSHRVLAPGACPAFCLALTVMIGVVLSIVEAALFFARPAEGLVQLAALPVVRAVIMLAYFAILVVCGCTFDDDEPAYYYQ